MWYFITGLICILLIWKNNKERNANITKYIILSILIPPVGFGLWQAEKPLIGNEERYGGKAWNVLKWVAIIHTVLCVVWFFVLVVFVSESASSARGEYADYQKAGSVIGGAIGTMMIAMVWFFGVVGSLVLGLILKKPITEKALSSTNI